MYQCINVSMYQCINVSVNFGRQLYKNCNTSDFIFFWNEWNCALPQPQKHLKKT